MKIHSALTLLLLTPAALAGAEVESVNLAKTGIQADTETDTGQDHIPYPEIDPNRVVAVFLKAVDKGELALFSIRIDRPMLEPERVEYVYTLDGRLPTIRVYSTIKTPVPLPDNPQLLMHGVTAVIDWRGQITEAVAHIHP
jgi:hypothetical protein